MPGGGAGSFTWPGGGSTRWPTSLGIRTLLTAEYASKTSLDGDTPATGRGSVMTTVRRAIAGIELSTEFSVVKLESFSMRGARMVLGNLRTRGARLLLY